MHGESGKTGKDPGGNPWINLLVGLVLCAAIVGAWIWWRPRPAATRKVPIASPPGRAADPSRTAAVPPGSTPILRAETPQANPPAPIVRTFHPVHPPGATSAPAPAFSVTGTPPAVVEPVPTRVTRTPAIDSTNLVSLVATNYPRPAETTFEVQLALARRALSPGSLDGVMGGQTRAAIRAFQVRSGLASTGALDDATRAALLLETPPLTNYVVTPDDLERLQPVSPTWLGKSLQTALEYETILELVAERSWASPRLLRKLNPTVMWDGLRAGTRVVVPAVEFPPPPEPAAFVRIQLAAHLLQAFGTETNLIAHFPCSIAQQVEKRPVGEISVIVVVPHPDYTFNPELFPDAPEARDPGRKLRIPPGPNNPVGVAWIGLGLPGYGIHGTPKPEDIGRTESRGCFRLANWNAEYLLRLVRVGTPVFVEP